MVQALITNFRRGKTTQQERQMIIKIPGVDKKKAATYLGKKVTWKTPGGKDKSINGHISRVHGNNGAMSVIFERGMPGQAIGTIVEVQ
ncbi:MAG TPA: 50S ribosomal protein L35ae [Candidatus Nanoarchaeia archaeon]|nr:50S ribosomal protein L35ae [Candidatus Nanoarchaeia archaeon]